MEMGTGKSRTLIELAFRRQDHFDRFFWFCPVSLKATVYYELLKHTDLEVDDICVWDDSTNERTVPLTARFHVVGIESMSSSDRIVHTFDKVLTDKSYVAVDESSYIKGHSSKRTERITAMASRAKYRAILNGTPFTQGAVDLYAQMRFLSPEILGYKSFYSFAANHLEYEIKRNPQTRQYVETKRIVRSHNVRFLAAKIEPYTFQVLKNECLTLPEKLYESRYCAMSSAQRGYYEQAKHEILLQHDPDYWTATTIFHLFTALQCIICGFWKRRDSRTGVQTLIEIDHDRIDTMLAAAEEIPLEAKVVVWAKYHYCVNQIVQKLTEVYGADAVQQYHGKISTEQRETQLAAWRASGRFLVATQASGGHGLTLNEAEYVIFYANSFKFSERIQAEDRNHRIGQTKRPVYVSLSCLDSIDERIARALDKKESALRSFQRSISDLRGRGDKNKAVEVAAKL